MIKRLSAIFGFVDFESHFGQISQTVSKWAGILFFLCSLIHADTGSSLKLIPAEDKEYLTSFFKGLLGNGSFALTLFGKKPATPFDYPSELIIRMEEGKLKREFLLQKKGWKLWKKYKDLFKFNNYLFLYTSNDFSSVWFVNKKTIETILIKHREFFKGYFFVDPLSVNLKDFLSKALVPNYTLNNFHIAQGLLLGFPWDSCYDFQERSRIDDTLAFFPYDVEEPHFVSYAAPASLLDGYPEDLFKKYARYKEGFSLKRNWENTNPFFSTIPGGYLAFDSIYEPQFEDVKKKIMKLYNSEYFLEELLAILTE